jgi:O-antigen ligase
MTEKRGGGDRVYYWQAGAKALWENPVFGMGGDESASQAAVAAFAPPGVQDQVMHNTYLEMAVEYGIFGGIFYIILAAFVLTWGYRLYKYALAKNELVIAAPAISYLLLMVAAVFVSAIWDTSIWYNLSMVLALAIQLVYDQYINKRKVNTGLTHAESVAM